MQLSEEERKGIAQRGFVDPVWFCAFFLNDWFPGRIPWHQRGLLAVLTRQTDFLLEYGELDKIVANFVWKENPKDPKSAEHSIFELEYQDGKAVAVHLKLPRFVAIMAPRGFAKTSVINAAVAYNILYQIHKFPVYLSETGSHSAMQLGNVKAELESNEKINIVFGSLKPEQRVDGLSWRENFIETTTGITVACRGRGGQVRGLNNRGNRPDYIILDDVEDKESVATEEQRAKTVNWLYSDVMPALPAMKPDASIVVVGTLLHSESMLQQLKNDPEFAVVTLAVLDKDGEPVWPENMGLEKIERIKTSYASIGKLNLFYMEYFNIIRNDDTAKFPEKFFIYGKAEQELFKALACDPAISEATTADFCAFGVVGMEKGGRHHILECCGSQGMSPREQVNTFFDLYHKFRPERTGVEAIAYQRALIHLLREEMFRKGTYFEIEEIKHGRVGKHERVEGVLQPRFVAGYIVFSKRFVLLESQLLDWPNGKKDFPDVIAMAITLLDPYAAQAANPELDLGNDEYEPLDEILGNWRNQYA